MKGDGKASGQPTLDAYARAIDFSGNVIERGSHPSIYPAGNTILAPGTHAPLLDPVTHVYPGPAGYSPSTKAPSWPTGVVVR